MLWIVLWMVWENIKSFGKIFPIKTFVAALVVMMTWRRSPWSCRWRRRGNQLQQRRILCRRVRTNVDICDTLSYNLKVSDVDEEVQETEEWKPKII